MSIPNPEQIPAGEIIQQMVDLGYEFQASLHSAEAGLTGYCAIFFKVGKYEEDDEPSWHESGHGHTFQEAVEEALAVCMGEATATSQAAFRR